MDPAVLEAGTTVGTSVKSIAFFNHKGGVGKTTMLFNIAVALGRLDKRVLLVDFDAQANLTAIALDDPTLEGLYAPDAQGMTVAHGFSPLVSGAGDIAPPQPMEVRKDRIWIVPGDISLSSFEEILPSRGPRRLRAPSVGSASRARPIACGLRWAVTSASTTS